MSRKPRLPRPEAADDALRYIETSVLLAAVLEREPEAIDALRIDGQRVTSALTFAEASRAIVRGGRIGRLTADEVRGRMRTLRTFERRCLVIEVSDQVLARLRRPFPVEPIRTLDAIHLATAELLGEPPVLMTIVTRDRRVEQNARALGYSVG